MRSLIFCIVGVGLSTLVWADDGCVCEVHKSRDRRSVEWGYSMASALVDSQTVRINTLTKMVDDLEDKLHHHSAWKGLKGMVHELERLVEKQEKPLCEKEYEFSCGRTSGQCLSEILVCDGHPDCDNEEDENPKTTCRNAVRPGTSWKGRVYWSGCTDRSYDDVELLITGNKLYEWFTSRIKVKARITLTSMDGTKRVYHTHGQYSYGMKELALEPDASDLHVGMLCVDGGRNVAECRFLNVGDQHECGRVSLKRKTK